MHRLVVVLAIMLAIGSAEARTNERVQDFFNQPIVSADGGALTDARVRRAIVAAVQQQY